MSHTSVAAAAAATSNILVLLSVQNVAEWRHWFNTKYLCYHWQHTCCSPKHRAVSLQTSRLIYV